MYIYIYIHTYNSVFTSGSQSTHSSRALFTRDISRRWVFLSCSRPSKGKERGEGGGRERKGAVVSGIRGGGGGFFCSFLAARRGDGRGGVSYTAGAPAASLLYEILIQGDIRQAYIRLACKSPPYLISRGCDAPGDDGSFYAAATFPSISPLFLVVVTFDHRRNIAVPLEKDRICACR